MNIFDILGVLKYLFLLLAGVLKLKSRVPEKKPVKIQAENRIIRRPVKGMFLILLLILIGGNVSQTQAQVPYKYGLSLGTGIYAAEGFGTNLSAAMRFNKYFEQGRHFIEGSFGITSIESRVLDAIANTQFFENNRLISLEFLYGYDPKMWTSLPYFTAGVASISQGGQSRFAGILGIGNRIHFDKIFGSKKIGLRYDLRDHIFKQSYNDNKSFFTHNLNLSLNLEFFF